jgi:glucose-6-phosphate 1-dehydrogenase
MLEHIESICAESAPPPCSIVIFGASGDLASRKLFPALFRLFERDLLPEKFLFIGFARTEMTVESFRERIMAALKLAGINAPRKLMDFVLSSIEYVNGAYDSPESYKKIEVLLAKFEEGVNSAGRLFYLSTPPNLFSQILKLLESENLVREDYDGIPWRRIVVEKPFGRDLESANELERELGRMLKERQIYRIDHYLGKETIQNILMLRFANSVFEPIWNNRFIESVQITAAETVGVEHRAGYFEKTGLLRDMFQNHMLQLLSLVAMEPPSSFDADRIRDEKAKLLNSLRPFPTNPSSLSNLIIRAQYGKGMLEGRKTPAYAEENGVAENSMTETYVAAKFHIDNWRWNGTHFYIRSGKRLAKRISEVAIKFRRIPHSIFGNLNSYNISQNELVLTIQPDEGFSMKINAKKQGSKFCMGGVEMDFKYSDLGGPGADAYERLLLDCMLGDGTLFIRKDSIELSWTLLDPVLKIWENPENLKSNPIFLYEAGSEGPAESSIIFGTNSDSWRRNIH